MADTNPNQVDDLSQAAVVPFRVRRGGIEICVITSKKGNWGIPKGIIDPGETPAEAGLKEAFEEAGLHGRIIGKPVGQFEYEKWERVLPVTVYLMEVTRIDDDWQEPWRERAWVSLDEAIDLVHRSELKKVLCRARKSLKTRKAA
jgi:8-oxo-dGTP pyrophosphatase MutT (NUDIX family)